MNKKDPTVSLLRFFIGLWFVLTMFVINPKNLINNTSIVISDGMAGALFVLYLMILIVSLGRLFGLHIWLNKGLYNDR